MRLEVPFAEVAEMLPLATLLSRSIDPAVRSRSKVLMLLYQLIALHVHCARLFVMVKCIDVAFLLVKRIELL